MEFIEPFLNYIWIAIAIVVVIILLVILSRMIGGRIRGRKGSRLGVAEIRAIDKTRTLLLVRRDDVEHLIMIGGGQSLVIEQGIGKNIPDEFASPEISRPRQVHEPEPEPEYEPEPQLEPERSHRPAPRAPVFADRAPNVRPIHRGEPRFNPTDDRY